MLDVIGAMGEQEQPSATRLQLEKTLPVPPERVFAAFADPERFREWWGPVGYTVLALELDVAEGRDYRLVMKPPDGDTFHIRGTFLEVDPPHRLEYTFVYEEPDPDDQETLVTLRFEPSHLGTRLVLEHGEFKTTPRWELHRVGWSETLERLERSLC